MAFGRRRGARSVLVRPARGDLLAGVSVALVLVPQSLAYAELAGLPAVHGLYAAAAAPVAASVVGSSPYLQTGPVALTSLLTIGALAPLAGTGTAEFAALAALLALLVGVARVALGLLRWGALSYLMSVPVVTGFTVGAAVLIIASQLPALVGVEGGRGESPLTRAAEVLAEPAAWSLAAVGIGLATILVLLAGRRISTVFPWVLAVTVAALLASTLEIVQAPVVGGLPSGLPPLSLALPWSAVPDLAVPALVIAVVGFAEPASIARRYAAADRHPWDPDREFVGQGRGWPTSAPPWPVATRPAARSPAPRSTAPPAPRPGGAARSPDWPSSRSCRSPACSPTCPPPSWRPWSSSPSSR